MESESGIKLQNITVDYGVTLVRELLRAGYSIAPDFAYHEDSKTVMCGFYREKRYIGELVFYDVTETPSFALLQDRAIDLVLLDSPHSPRYAPKPFRIPGKRAKLMWTLVIHLAAFGLFMIMHITPSLFAVFRNTEFGILLVALPTIIIALIWAPFDLREEFAPKGKGLQKAGFALWMAANFIFSVAYIFAVDYYFRIYAAH